MLRLSPNIDSGLIEWFKAHLNWIITSEQGARARAKGNNISIWYNALVRPSRSFTRSDEQVSTHLVFLNPGEMVPYPSDFLAECMTRYPDSKSFFAQELQRTRPRHYTLFILEPCFIIAGASGDPPSHRILAYLHALVSFAKTVQPGELEVDADNDERYRIKLRWFEKMLDRWDGHEAKYDLEGAPWEGGWNMFARISWGLL